MSTRWIIIIVVFFVVGISTALFARHFQREEGALRIGGEEFRVLLADDEAERIQGLSGMPSLADDTVMLFVFPNDDKHGIWMKDMHFAIDIVWLDQDGYVIHIKKDATPDSFPEIFRPDDNAGNVIEMSAGIVDRLALEQGHQVQF